MYRYPQHTRPDEPTCMRARPGMCTALDCLQGSSGQLPMVMGELTLGKQGDCLRAAQVLSETSLLKHITCVAKLKINPRRTCCSCLQPHHTPGWPLSPSPKPATHTLRKYQYFTQDRVFIDQHAITQQLAI